MGTFVSHEKKHVPKSLNALSVLNGSFDNRTHIAELFIGQNSVVRVFGRPQPNRKFAEVDRPSHPLDLYLPLQIAARRNGRADKSALVSVAQYAGSSVPVRLM